MSIQILKTNEMNGIIEKLIYETQMHKKLTTKLD